MNFRIVPGLKPDSGETPIGQHHLFSMHKTGLAPGVHRQGNTRMLYEHVGALSKRLTGKRAYTDTEGVATCFARSVPSTWVAQFRGHDCNKMVAVTAQLKPGFVHFGVGPRLFRTRR
jgi:hypothetical protein